MSRTGTPPRDGVAQLVEHICSHFWSSHGQMRTRVRPPLPSNPSNCEVPL